jgi:D-threonate/D-erythronate kinase
MRLLADDLTGALDTAARFTTRLGPIPVHLGPKVPDVSGHAALDLACRDGSQSAAIAATRAAAAFLNDDLPFKKVDSLLRGHWPAELAALLATGSYRHCVFAPAFPEQGRVTLQGRQHVVDDDGNIRPLAVDIGAALAQHGLTMIQADETALSQAAAPGCVFVFDSRTPEDLARVVRQGQSLSGPILWCGAAGLAGALAGVPPRNTGRIVQPALALIGSHHPVMLAQIEAARQAKNCAVIALGSDPAGEARQITAALATHACCIAYFALPDGLSAPAAARLIAQHLHILVPCLAKPASLIAAGGETLRAICEASAVDHLLVLGENRPGIPCSRICGGLWDGISVLSKSGAFGPRSFFTDLF